MIRTRDQPFPVLSDRKNHHAHRLSFQIKASDVSIKLNFCSNMKTEEQLIIDSTQLIRTETEQLILQKDNSTTASIPGTRDRFHSVTS